MFPTTMFRLTAGPEVLPQTDTEFNPHYPHKNLDMVA